MNVNVIGGSWLKNRDNYDVEMAAVNNWQCVQARHYDVVIEDKLVEVKKTKTTSVIIKLQQLAELMISGEDVHYLIVRTNKDQDSIVSTHLVHWSVIAGLVDMTLEDAQDILSIHTKFKSTIQCTISTKNL